MTANLPAAELWLTLSQAFLPPREPSVARAFRDGLAEDLAGYAADLGIGSAGRLDAFRESLHAFADDTGLLVHYSSLFLSPPVPAHLNVGFHLDGSLYGPTQDALDAWFAHFGVERSAAFHDLPDHLAAALEFLAMLSARADPGEEPALFAQRFLVPALPPLCREIEGVGDSPYLHLARFTLDALNALAAVRQAEVPAAKKRNRRSLDPAKGALRCCKVCGRPYAREKEIRLLTAALASHGLPADHLDTCPECRKPAAVLS